MNRHLSVEKYFKYAVPISQQPAHMPFVTISREAGAGGHSLAATLAARLSEQKEALFSGWQVFDRSLCERVAADPELKVSLESLLNEEFHEGLNDYLRSEMGARSPQNKIDHHFFRTVRSVCAVGKAIVIGRASAFVTHDLPLGVHVRLVADHRTRIANISRETGLGATAARKSIDQKDSRRARLIKTYFRKDITEPSLYDCVWNTATVPFDTIADSVLALIRQRTAQGSAVKAALSV